MALSKYIVHWGRVCWSRRIRRVSVTNSKRAVSRKVILELKAVDQVLPIHRAQLLTYLKLSGNRLGFVINVNVPRLKDGIERFVL